MEQMHLNILEMSEVTFGESSNKKIGKELFGNYTPDTTNDEVFHRIIRLGMETEYQRRGILLLPGSTDVLNRVLEYKMPTGNLSGRGLEHAIFAMPAHLSPSFITGPIFSSDNTTLTECGMGKDVAFGTNDVVSACYDFSQISDLLACDKGNDVRSNPIPFVMKFKEMLRSKSLAVTSLRFSNMTINDNRLALQRCKQISTIITIAQSDEIAAIGSEIGELRKELNIKSNQSPQTFDGWCELRDSLRVSLKKRKTTLIKKKTPRPKATPVKTEPPKLKVSIKANPLQEVPPSEYKQFIELVAELKGKSYPTREALGEAAKDLNRSAPEPQTYYAWKTIVEKEANEGTPVISDDVADKLKKGENNMADLVSQIKKIQNKLGIDEVIPSGKKGRIAKLKSLQLLAATIPSMKAVKKKIDAYRNTLNISDDHYPPTLLSAYTLMDILKDQVDEAKQLRSQRLDFQSQTNTVENKENNIYFCIAPKCGNQVKVPCSYCKTCKEAGVRKEKLERRDCITDGCNEWFSCSPNSDRELCPKCKGKKVSAPLSTTMLTEEVKSEFVEWFTLYLQEEHGLFDAIVLSAEQLQLVSEPAVDKVCQWCSRYVESLDVGSNVGSDGRIWRSGDTKRLFISMYDDLLAAGFTKAMSRIMASHITGTAEPSSMLLSGWRKFRDKSSSTEPVVEAPVVSEPVTEPVVAPTNEPQPNKVSVSTSTVTDHVKAMINNADKSLLNELESVIASRKSVLKQVLLDKKAEIERMLQEY